MIRQLNIEELESEIHDQALKIEYVERQHLLIQLHQFFNFIESQPISQRILQRIEEDYAELKGKIPQPNTPIRYQQIQELLSILKTPDQQGAFGYLLIIQTFKSAERLHINDYLDLTRQWYNTRGDYNQSKEDFNTLFFKPFIKLLLWYISESQSHNANDYFSKKEVDEFSLKLDNLLTDIRLGQEIIFEEIQDLKEQLKNLKKKNWGEVLKGKLFDLTVSNVISVEMFSEIIKAITGEGLKFLK